MAGTPLQYLSMWSLVQQNYNGSLCPDDAFRSIVSQELLMAIFWEETQFANLRQKGKTGPFTHNDWLKAWTEPRPPPPPPPKPGEKPKLQHLPGAHAVGFGQVERETIGRIKALGPDKLDGLIPGTLGKDVDLKTIDEAILADDGKGVQITWRYLHYLYGAGIKSKSNLAKSYGGNPDLPNVHLEWMNCETVQLGFQRMPPTVTTKTFRANALLLAGAFWIARKNGDFPRAFYGVTQDEAAQIGPRLRAIVTGKTLTQPVLADLQNLVAEVARKNP